MSRIAKNVPALESSLPGLRFSNTEDIPLYRQVYQKLRSAITSGKIKAGTKLPATRTLAQTHGISRNTVLIAFEQLIGEGFLETLECQVLEHRRRLALKAQRLEGGCAEQVQVMGHVSTCEPL
jgi:DNA-binding transcriptional regulator YhcF (GntR family)